MENVTIRDAYLSDMEWINAEYAKIDFKLSNFESEKILILETKGQKAAIGRLVRINKKTAELGGILVLPEFRSRKYAELIVGHLLTLRSSYETIYCLPFSKLESFYKRLGFRDVHSGDLAKVPEQIMRKLEWCNQMYEDNTLLLVQ